MFKLAHPEMGYITIKLNLQIIQCGVNKWNEKATLRGLSEL